ncbi:DNA-3-methyladenine glycosylase 2 family protein [Paenibacillus flagellatus]|nr:Ada metal-binding domain-containing protein [Paenibacillus flagellatus]
MDPDLWNTILTRDRKYDGIYWLGIRTTGIYCRPSCRSRLPRIENVRVFASAEEARQAGFRACKRCKPDTPGHNGPDAELTARVNGLLASRPLDPPTLGELAAELNVSPFHLQRTFKRITGTSPSALAAKTRLDAAAKRLAETDDSVTQVAGEAGFRSASHFAAAFRKAFGTTPTAFRQAASDTIEIAAPEPFDYRQMLVYLARSPQECMYRVADDRIRLALAHEGAEEPLLLEVSASDAGRLLVRFLSDGDKLGPAPREAAVRHVREWFDLDTDLRPFYLMAETDPVLSRLVRDYRGLRIAGVPDLFEALCWAVIGQQITLSFAYTLKRRFVETFGRAVEHEGETYWLFPSPDTVAGLSVERLTALQFSRQKAAYVIEVARQIADGSLSKRALLALPDFAAAAERLTSIRGIGPWTAQYVLMRCLRDRSAFPAEDAGVHQAVRRLWKLDCKPSPRELRERFASWTPWRAYVTFYLWRSLQDDETPRRENP